MISPRSVASRSQIRKMFSKILIISIVCIYFAASIEDKARYDNYRLFYIVLATDDQVILFQQLLSHFGTSDSYRFVGSPRATSRMIGILAAAHKIADLTDLLISNNVFYQVLDYNFQLKIDTQAQDIKPIDAPVEDFDWKGYYQLETIYAWMDYLCAKYPNIITPIELGKSYEGIPIRALKLSRKPNNTAVFIESGIHAGEWISPATATFILNQLIISKNQDVRDISFNFDWYFCLVLNPDGYKASFENDRFWRKNRQRYGVCRGTDLNRNFDIAWNTTGTGTDPCDVMYPGPQHLTNYMKSIVKTQMVQTYISLHSYGQLVLFPHGYTTVKVWNYDDLKAIGEKTVEAIAKRYGSVYLTGSGIELLYPTSGTSCDYMYTTLNVPITYTIELRGPRSSTDLSILPADQIEPTGWETLDGFVALLKEGRARGYYDVGKILAVQHSSFSC